MAEDQGLSADIHHLRYALSGPHMASVRDRPTMRDRSTWHPWCPRTKRNARSTIPIVHSINATGQRDTPRQHAPRQHATAVQRNVQRDPESTAPWRRRLCTRRRPSRRRGCSASALPTAPASHTHKHTHSRAESSTLRPAHHVFVPHTLAQCASTAHHAQHQSRAPYALAAQSIPATAYDIG